jgi:CheY-like chemotaxis protein
VDDLVLIADGDRDRARALAAALAESGFRTALAEHGAAGLEAALTHPPDVLLATDRLPLIDASRLSEILRANPRTRELRLVYLGSDAGAMRAKGAFDEVLPDATTPEQAALRVRTLLGIRERLDAALRASAEASELTGQLAQIPLTDLLQLFHQNRRTGRIRVRRRDAVGANDQGEIWLREGNVIHAAVGPRVEGEKAVYRLLAWREGEFSFAPVAWEREAKLQTPTRALLLEGMRQLDEWDRLRSGLPTESTHVALAVQRSDIPNVVHPVALEVLELVQRHEDVQSIVDQSTHSDYQVLRTLQTLSERGIVRLRRERERRLASPSGALFDGAQVKRFRDWLEAGRPRGSALPRAKLLLTSSDHEAVHELLHALTVLPGVTLTREAERETFRASDLVRVGEIAVGDGLLIELLHVPAAPAFAPLWPIAGHAALGMLCVLTAPVAAAEERLAPISAAVQRLPGARTFHLLLLRKGEKVAPEEVHAKLALLDRSSLFLLPLEGEREPGSLLRTMLARVMP